MTLFEEITAVQSPDASREALAAVEAKFGMVPNVAKVLAAHPGTLKAYLAMRDALGDDPLGGADAEAVALAVSAFNGCTYCTGAHSGAAMRYGSDDEEVALNLKGESRDPKRRAFTALVLRMMEKRGAVSEEEIQNFRDDGLTAEDFVAATGWVAANVLTNFVNRLAKTEPDFG